MSDKEAPKRSPNFPAVSLEDSLANARTLYDRDKLAATSADVIVGHLGYKKLHGTSRRVVSAMKSYGLLDEMSDSRFKVSDTAFKLINADINSPTAVGLLCEAALKPTQFRTLIEEYKGDIPSDRTLASYLVLDKGFTPDGAQTFIKVLRENVEFASITPDLFSETTDDNHLLEDTVNLGVEQRTSDSSLKGPSSVGGMDVRPAGELPTYATKETVLNFKISRKSEARIIFYGEDVTQEAIDQLARLLDTSKPVYPTEKELEEERSQPKNAVWKNKDYDQPVTVTGELGKKDGKKFYSIKESSTGISEDELDFDGTGKDAGI